MNQDIYLNRFKAQSYKEVSLINLAQLQKLHLESIPFENLDVIRNVPIYLNLSLIYSKIVESNRGGYCYELNGLFHWLLIELGYDAQLVAATVLRTTGHWAKADTHTAIIVQLDEPYLVDVGFGTATPRRPIPLNGKSLQDTRASFHIDKKAAHSFDIVRKSKSEERVLYRFSNEQRTLIDFHEGCVFNQVSKESTFTHFDIVTRSTANGQLTLNDSTLTRLEDGVQTKEVLSDVEKTNVLKKLFGISLE